MAYGKVFSMDIMLSENDKLIVLRISHHSAWWRYVQAVYSKYSGDRLRKASLSVRRTKSKRIR
ncbi:hypothetical protein CS546_09015 [Porphyromonas gingivalis]|nr:hypothetical protein CS546_09015 [Porphyromonas gingivalis]ATR96405.1 hypothetical protein CS548_04495 [Porphyromonas gingivalis]PDP47104.1 hypothetical protein CLI82_03850 [Porphyromonas gingivalis]